MEQIWFQCWQASKWQRSATVRGALLGAPRMPSNCWPFSTRLLHMKETRIVEPASETGAIRSRLTPETDEERSALAKVLGLDSATRIDCIESVECLFCGQDASHGISEEHIVPVALGNNSHNIAQLTPMVLQPGIVCDVCNSYFGSNIEVPFVESGTGMIRSLLGTKGRRGRETSLRIGSAGNHKDGRASVQLGDGMIDQVTHIKCTNLRQVPIEGIHPSGRTVKVNLTMSVGTYLTSAFLSKVCVEYFALCYGRFGVLLSPDLRAHRKNARYPDRDKWLPFYCGRTTRAQTDPRYFGLSIYKDFTSSDAFFIFDHWIFRYILPISPQMLERAEGELPGDTFSPPSLHPGPFGSFKLFTPQLRKPLRQ